MTIDIRFVIFLALIAAIVYLVYYHNHKLKQQQRVARRIGIRYFKTDDDDVNNLIKDFNNAIDYDMKNVFCKAYDSKKVPAQVHMGLQKMPSCKKVVSMAPENIRGRLKSRICKPDDSYNERGVVSLVENLENAVCSY